jgi:hypothetical protein
MIIKVSIAGDRVWEGIYNIDGGGNLNFCLGVGISFKFIISFLLI